MLNKKAFTSLLVLNATVTLQLQDITSYDLRRLAVFAKDIASDTAMVKKLRRIVAMYRLNPIDVLDLKGVGPMTLLTVQKISAQLSANEVKAEFGVGDNLDAVLTISNNFKRGVSGEIRQLIEEGRANFQKARMLLENEKLKQGLKKSIAKNKVTTVPSKRSIKAK